MRIKGSTWLRGSLAVSIVAFALSACGSKDDGDDGGSKSTSGGFQCTGSTAATTACCDFGDATVAMCVRCFGVSESVCADAVQTGIETASYGQGCAGADGIRDADAFYNDCLPALETVSCSDAEAGNLPASCQDQILYEM